MTSRTLEDLITENGNHLKRYRDSLTQERVKQCQNTLDIFHVDFKRKLESNLASSAPSASIFITPTHTNCNDFIEKYLTTLGFRSRPRSSFQGVSVYIDVENKTFST